LAWELERPSASCLRPSRAKDTRAYLRDTARETLDDAVARGKKVARRGQKAVDDARDLVNEAVDAGQGAIAKRATPSSAELAVFLAHDLGGGEKNGLALDTRDHSGDSLVARMVSSYTLGGFVHILLVLAIVVVLIRVIQGRRPV